MLDAERRAAAPDDRTAAMDRHVMAYLRGEAPLDAAVEACVRALGPRPVLAVSIAHADATTRDRLHALQAALSSLRGITG